MLSKKQLRCIEAFLYIANHAGAKPVSASEVCDHLGLHKRHLEKELRFFASHGLLVGSSGPKGGYRLARERRKISLRMICELVIKLEGTISQADDRISSTVLTLNQSITDSTLKRLEHVTLEEICKQHGNVTRGGGADFSI